MDIPNYQLGEKIGEGGMASVYKARHKFLNKEAAVKIMFSSLSSKPVFQKCFINEACIIDTLKHNNIVKVYDMGVKDDVYYITMEYLDGGNLQDLLKKGAISFTKALYILKSVASALSYVHSKGFIHRDVKPANILFRNDGSVILTDFGIAKLEGSTGELTKIGLTVSTPFYMAPEQAIQNENLDNRVDIYSLGIVFYEMLVGQKPFSAGNTAAVLFQHTHTEIPHLPPNYAKLQVILDKVLAKNVADRYSTVTEFLEDIDAVILKNKKNKKEEIKKIILPSTQKWRYYKYGLLLFLTLVIAILGYFLYKKEKPITVIPTSIDVPLPTQTSDPKSDPISTKPDCSIKERLGNKC